MWVRISIYGDGKQVRDMLYIDDLIADYKRVIDQIARISGAVYNIGGGPTREIPVTYEGWCPLVLTHILLRWGGCI